jgi:hypothetical protein
MISFKISKPETKTDGTKGDLHKPKFTNSKGVPKKEIGTVNKEPTADKLDAPRKFVNTSGLTKAAEENAKIKAPTKSHVDDTKLKKEEPQIEIEKPKFKPVHDGSEPHFKDINKNEDVNIPLISAILEENE